MNQTVPAGLSYDYVMGEGLNEFKRNFIQYILPPAYINAPLGTISLANVIYDQVNRNIFFNGFVDQLPGVNITALNKTVGDNIKAVTGIVPFGAVVNPDVKVYPYDPTVNTNTNGTVANVVVPAVAPTDVSGGVPLAAILVPSIVGGLILLSLLACLLCYCCKWCCFKKKVSGDGTEVYTQNRDRPPMAVVPPPPAYGEFSDRRMVPTKL